MQNWPQNAEIGQTGSYSVVNKTFLKQIILRNQKEVLEKFAQTYAL